MLFVSGQDPLTSAKHSRQHAVQSGDTVRGAVLRAVRTESAELP